MHDGSSWRSFGEIMSELSVPENTPEPLDGKNAAERIALARAILDAAQRGLYTLSAIERAAVNRFIMLTTQRNEIDAETVGRVNFLARQHKQHLIALTRRVR
jgi:predicted ATPase with chaperone activity